MRSRFLSNLLTAAPGAAEAFLVDWYGEPRRVARLRRTAEHLMRGRQRERDDPGAVPPPLRRLSELVRRWPQAVVQNDVILPPDFVDGHVRFYVENQGVYEWATDPDGGEDAVVWGREPEAEEWTREEPRLGPFILQLLVFEAVIGSKH